MWRLGTVGLILAAGCSPPLAIDESEHDETGEEEGTADDESLDMQAVVYATSSTDGPGGAYYLRRLGEEPILLGASESAHVDLLCLQRDGTGYVRWWPRDDLQENPIRIEAFAIGEDWVESGGPSPFPPEFYAAGCPMGWTPDAYFVNLIPTGTGDAAFPYRALMDGTVHPVLAATSSWFGVGGYALETTLERSVLWVIEGGVPRIARTFDNLHSAHTTGRWLVLEFGDESVELLSPTAVDQVPILLFDGSASSTGRFPWYSPSELVVALAEHDEAQALSSVDLMRIEGDTVVQRRRFDLEPSVPAEAVPTDSGWMVVLTRDGVWAASFDDDPRDVVNGEDQELLARVSQEEDLVVFGLTPAGSPTAHSVHDLRDGSTRTLEVPPSCRLVTAIAGFGYFSCDNMRFERVALRSPKLELESLAPLTPFSGLIPTRVAPRSWNGEDWYSLFYSNDPGEANDGGVSVLMQADGGATIETAHSNTTTSWVRLFPTSG